MTEAAVALRQVLPVGQETGCMPEVMFAGPDGRLEGRYHHSKETGAPVALILHPHPLHGGTMNNRITYSIYQAFQKLGCCLLYTSPSPRDGLLSRMPSSA